MDNYKYILFDIDGVLAKATNSAVNILIANNITQEAFFKNWSLSKSVNDFEAGNLTVEEFAEVRVKELDLLIKPEAIINILTARKSVLYHGVEELLEKLTKRNYKLACLSNTNVIHWNSIEGKEVFDQYFVEKFLSYEIGLTKPQKEVFLYVLNTLQCQPYEILYFDDSKRNIDAALSLKLDAVQVNDFYDLSEKIIQILR